MHSQQAYHGMPQALADISATWPASWGIQTASWWPCPLLASIMLIWRHHPVAERQITANQSINEQETIMELDDRTSWQYWLGIIYTAIRCQNQLIVLLEVVLLGPNHTRDIGKQLQARMFMWCNDGDVVILCALTLASRTDKTSCSWVPLSSNRKVDTFLTLLALHELLCTWKWRSGQRPYIHHIAWNHDWKMCVIRTYLHT